MNICIFCKKEFPDNCGGPFYNAITEQKGFVCAECGLAEIRHVTGNKDFMFNTDINKEKLNNVIKYNENK
jgi:hypothetical protein